MTNEYRPKATEVQRSRLEFATHGLQKSLTQASRLEFDALQFGLIGFNKNRVVANYNLWLSTLTNRAPRTVLGSPLEAALVEFEEAESIMERFLKCIEKSESMDETHPCSLATDWTQMMQLRLLFAPNFETSFILVQRERLPDTLT